MTLSMKCKYMLEPIYPASYSAGACLSHISTLLSVMFHSYIYMHIFVILSRLCKIEDVSIRQLVSSMLQREPLNRLSAKQYLEKFSSHDSGPSLFPPSFDYLFQSQKSLVYTHGLLPDARVKNICSEVGTLLKVSILYTLQLTTWKYNIQYHTLMLCNNKYSVTL